ncbi:MAG: phenylacetic acid degradation operon negative regulatory protein PaaX [Proteobacteria bacterium]|nr:phenylacetic acid degradation operon negative regulatory protein PaaX [Pseudomonadota bacterium]
MPGKPASPPALTGLLRRFRAQRPLRGGSLLVTIFGDAIAPRGGAVTLQSLIALAGPFGLTERLVRTAAARLAREGWLATRRQGRRSEYRLSGSGAARFAEATARIYALGPGAWDGRWRLLILPPGVRTPARQALHWLGHGEIAPGVFAHPAGGVGEARAARAAAPGALTLEAAADPAAERALVQRGWDLDELRAGYLRFLRRFTPLEPAVRARTLGAPDAFLVRTLLVHEYRKIHLQDPLLPARLLPQDWAGTRAADLARSIYTAVFNAAERHLEATAERLAGPLPPPAAATYARFGGLPRP